MDYNIFKKNLQTKKKYFELLEQIKEFEYEIEDSNYFIAALGKRKKALEDSEKTRESLGNLKLTQCPNCLSPLMKSELKDICFLM